MKTTIEIPDTLFRRLREHAAANGTTIKSVVQAALQQFMGGTRRPSRRFKLRDGSFRGSGLMPGIKEGDWSRLVERIYEGRGGAGEVHDRR